MSRPTAADVAGAGEPERLALGPATVLCLHPVVVRPEGEDFVVGRVETGEFVSVPAIGARAVELLGQGLAIGEVEAGLREEFGVAPDVVAFADQLLELGFVAAVDGVRLSSGEPAGATMPWLRRAHVAWLFSIPAKVVVALTVAAGVVAMVLRPEVVPSFHDVLLARSTSLVVLGTTALFLLVVAAHETAHLAAARSLDVPARMSLGTRLYSLVAQTDVSGLWALPRSKRYRGYLAGMVWDATVAGATLVVLATGAVTGEAARVLAALLAILAVGIAAQFQLFMRTDLYFVLSDLLGARNLYGDATLYLLSLVRRLLRPGRRGARVDPLATLPPRERRAVHAYAWFMLVASAVALGVFAVVIAPALIVLLVRSALDLVRGIRDHDLLRALDGAVSLVVEGGFQALFVVVFVSRRRGAMVRLRARLASLEKSLR